MKCLVTGGAGFIGSHIADLFIKNNHDVVIIDNLVNGNKKNLSSKIKFYQADILDNLNEIFKKEEFDIIIHNAALIGVTESELKPRLYKKINVDGTINLLEHCRKFNIKKFIYASSSAIYGTPKYLPCDEKHPKKPINVYGKTKLEAENKIIDYSGRYGISYVILRYSNIYGPRQHTLKGGVVAKFFNNIINNKSLVIFGDGAQTRDFLFVGNAAQANICALKTNNRIFNIGSGKETSINQLCKEINRLLNKKIKITHQKPLNEIRGICLDISSAKKELHWQPKTEFSVGLKKTLRYLQKNI